MTATDPATDPAATALTAMLAALPEEARPQHTPRLVGTIRRALASGWTEAALVAEIRHGRLAGAEAHRGRTYQEILAIADRRPPEGPRRQPSEPLPLAHLTASFVARCVAEADQREAAEREAEAEAAKLERWAAYAAAHPEEAADTQALIDALHPDRQTPHLGQEPTPECLTRPVGAP